MNIFRSLASLTLLLVTITEVVPDREAPAYPYEISAAGGRFYFRMRPDTADRYVRDKGSGAIYAVGADGIDRKIWSVDGWYAFITHLSHDGRYLIRIGNLPRGNIFELVTVVA